MREHPWHLPSSTTKHYQSFRNLADFHDLTLAWLKELQLPQLPHLMPRCPSQTATDNLWMLDSLNETQIDLMTDDTSPDDVLGRLKQTVWTVQAWTLISLFERTPEKERPSLRSLLEQISWRQGRRLAESRWSHLSAEARGDLKQLIFALQDSPFGVNENHLFLIRRFLPKEAVIELHHCPHQVEYPEVKQIADELCMLHIQWIRGFAYAMNHQVLIEDRRESPRCILCWRIVESP